MSEEGWKDFVALRDGVGWDVLPTLRLQGEGYTLTFIFTHTHAHTLSSLYSSLPGLCYSRVSEQEPH